MSVPSGDAPAVPPIQSAKITLRRTLLAARSRLVSAPIDAAVLLAVPEIAAASVVAAYAPLPGEPDILTALSGLPLRVLLPVILDDLDLDFRLLNGPLAAGRMGILTPSASSPTVSLEAADVVLAPALAADRLGHRLGRGGGCYDQALTRVRPDALVIAVVHPSELLDSVPVENHDVPVGAVLAGPSLIRVPR